MNGTPRSSSPVEPSRPRNSLVILLVCLLTVTCALVFFLNHKPAHINQPASDSVAIPETPLPEPAPEPSSFPTPIQNDSAPVTFQNQNPHPPPIPVAPLPVLSKPTPTRSAT